MRNFFQLITAHRHLVTINQEAGVLSSSSGLLQRHVPVLGSALKSRKGVILLTSEAEETSPFFISPRPSQKLSSVLFRHTGHGRIALMHPLSGRFLTATPESGAPLVNDARKIQEWELFEYLPVDQQAVTQGALDRLKRIESFLSQPITANYLRLFLAEAEDASDTLNIVLPLLPTSFLDEMASACLTDSTLVDLISRACQSDRWAAEALPAINRWYQRHEKPSSDLSASGQARITDVSETREIGPDLDFLGATGLDGSFTSFAHACTLRARRQVQPHKKIAILATARNEGIYLLEWIAYYRCLGVDAFFIYSNDNDDGSDELLAALAEAGIITWISSLLDHRSGNAQFKAYGHALSFTSDLLAYEWVLVIDLDEFLVLDRDLFPTIHEFCDWQKDRGVQTVAINWAMMGSQEILPDSGLSLIQRNLRLLPSTVVGDGARLVKSMARTNAVCHSEAHIPFCDERSIIVRSDATGHELSWHTGANGFPHSPKFADDVLHHPAIIYHYIFKSAEEWLWKAARNGGDHAIFGNEAVRLMDQTRAKTFLSQIDCANTQLSTRALDSAQNHHTEIESLIQIPEISKAHKAVQARYNIKINNLRSAYKNSSDIKDWDQDAVRFLRLAKIL